MKIYVNPEIENNSVIYYSVSEEKYSVSEAKPDTQNITEYSVYQNIQNNSVQLYLNVFTQRCNFLQVLF